MSLPQIFEHPFSFFDSLHADNNVLNQLLRQPRTQDDDGHVAFLPACDIKETKTGFTVKADLPGIKKDDIKVHIKDGVLQIEADSSSEEEEKDGDRVLRSERRYGRYVRRFNLGQHTGQDDIKASFDNGVLTLDIAKQSTPEPKESQIKIS